MCQLGIRRLQCYHIRQVHLILDPQVVDRLEKNISLGQLFVDVIDELTLEDKHSPPDYHGTKHHEALT
jgi:hypothetical protein